jgi:hypothetical protein
MADAAIRIEACRLAVSAAARDLPLTERMEEIEALARFFESLLRIDETPSFEAQDYPKIGEPR